MKEYPEINRTPPGSVVFNLIKNSMVPLVFSKVPWAILGRWVDINPLIAYYHIVSDDRVPHVEHLYRFRKVSQFRRDIDTLVKTYNWITLEDLLSSLKSARALPPDAFMLTFDDGFREIYDVIAPILLQKGLPATFFITTGCLDNLELAYHNKISLVLEQLNYRKNKLLEEKISAVLLERGIEGSDVRTALLRIDYQNRDILETIGNLAHLDFQNYLTAQRPYLTSEQVRKLISLGFSIGGHSIDHPSYSALSLDEQLRQTRTSVQTLRTRFSLRYGAFAFPHGANGVSGTFFREIFADGDVDISFGTAGMLKDTCPRHLERFCMEYTDMPAESVIGRSYARGIFKRMIGQQLVHRT